MPEQGQWLWLVLQLSEATVFHNCWDTGLWQTVHRTVHRTEPQHPATSIVQEGNGRATVLLPVLL